MTAVFKINSICVRFWYQTQWWEFTDSWQDANDTHVHNNSNYFC